MGWWLGGGLPVVAMLALNVVAAVLVSLVKVAMDGGLNPLVLVTLQQLTAAMFLGPIAYFKERCSFMHLYILNDSVLPVIASNRAQEVQAKAHTGDLCLSLRQCCTRGSSKAVHDLRCFEVHHGDLRHRLLQYRSCSHILACHLNTVRITGPEEKDRHCKACGHTDISSRSHGADILQGRGCHSHRQDPLTVVVAGAAPPWRWNSSGRSSHEQQELDAGHGGHPGQLRVPLLLVPPPQQARQEVPPCLLLQCLHVHVQLPPGGRGWPLHPTQRLRLDRQDQVPHTHHPLRRCGGVWPFVCATDMVHRKARPRVRRSLHSGGADHCFSN